MEWYSRGNKGVCGERKDTWLNYPDEILRWHAILEDYPEMGRVHRACISAADGDRLSLYIVDKTC